MKRRILALLLALLMACALLTGCGDKQAATGTPAAASSAAQEAEAPAAEASAAAASSAAESAAVESAAESAAEASAAAQEAEAPEASAAPGAEAVSPYAWQGLEDMPQCAYLDALCTYHYYREFTGYAMGYSSKQIEAVDGVNSYKETGSTRTYSVGGHIITFNDSAKNYMEYDMSGALIDQATAAMEDAMTKGTNTPGRVFVTTGSGVIPQYSEVEGDETEYEYYEYNYPAYEERGYGMVERFYLKDGDVFAITQQMSKDGEQVTESAEVIQSMSGEIPEGTFDIPSTDGYEKMES